MVTALCLYLVGYGAEVSKEKRNLEITLNFLGKPGEVWKVAMSEWD